MFFSVSKAFERKRMKLNRIANIDIPLTSEEALHHSKQVDHFINHYKNQNLSDLDILGNVKGATLTIKIKGQLDIVSSELLTSYLDINKHKWKSLQELYIDLSELNFFDTSGIQSLILLILEAMENNISIKAIKTTKTSFEVLNIMGFPNALKEFNGGTLIVI